MSSSTQSIPENAEDAELEGSPAGVRSLTGAPVDQVWRHLISPRGTEALLGPGVTLGSKGESLAQHRRTPRGRPQLPPDGAGLRVVAPP